MSDSLRNAVARLMAQERLEADETTAAVESIMAGGAPPALVGAFLATTRALGVTVDQVVGAARAMRAHAQRVDCGRSPLVDNCGTGGDGASTFSISTAAAVVAAGAGAFVAKHGNRAASGRFGGADALEAMGVHIDLPPDAVGRCLDEVGMAFLFARRLHPAMRHVAPIRSELGAPTLFNLLGPLTNPAGVRRQVIGVASTEALELVSGALAKLGCEHALVLHGRDGLDEVSLAAPVDAVEIRDGELQSRVLDAASFDLPETRPGVARVETLEESVAVIREVLGGGHGPRTDIVVANAALTLYVAGAAGSLIEATEQARGAIENGSARGLLEDLAQFTQSAHADAENATG